jgi:hypothetical protein
MLFALERPHFGQLAVKNSRGKTSGYWAAHVVYPNTRILPPGRKFA